MDVAGLLLAVTDGHQSAVTPPMPLRRLGGVPLVLHAARALRASLVVDSLTVVAPPDGVDAVREALDGLPEVAVVAGGPDGSRHESVHLGLAAVGSGIVLVHDACRPLAPPELAVRAVEAVRGGADLAVPVLEMTETVKELDAGGWITRTVPRETLVRIQAPAAVRREVLVSAHRSCSVLDESSWLTGSGIRAVAVEGHDDAFAVLHDADLDLAAAVLAGRAH